MITQGEVSRYAFQQGKPDKVIEQDYVITWILLGISSSGLRHSLAFKGGTALRKIYFPQYRYSQDLDFTIVQELDDAILIGSLNAVLDDLEKSVAFVFNLDEERIERRADSITMYIDFVGPLQGLLGSRDIKVDFTLREQLVAPLEERPVIALYSDCENLTRTLGAYSLEEILIEKLCALIGRTEPRDLFDTNFLLHLGNLDYQIIPEGFAVKARSKAIDPDRLREVLEERKPTIARLWGNRLALHVDELPHLETVLRETKGNLRRYGII